MTLIFNVCNYFFLDPYWKINRKAMSKCFKQQTFNRMIPSLNEAVQNHINTYSVSESGLSVSEKLSNFFLDTFIGKYFR